MTTEPTPLQGTAAEGMRYLANVQAALPSIAQTGANLVAALAGRDFPGTSSGDAPLGRPAVADLAAQIREQIDAWVQPTGIIVDPKPLSPAEYDDLAARFKAAVQTEPIRVLPPWLFDRLRAALFAILEPGVDLPCETVERVAKELGIEVPGD